ncbi:MAG: cyclic nucleotide-binding domain-containing protein, partial [Hyphomicrobiaceae bacterium]
MAVVGGGAAGVGAAIALRKAGMDVALLEAGTSLGGHCNAVSVPLWDGRAFRIDAGVREIASPFSARLTALVEELGLSLASAGEDIACHSPERTPLWFTRDGKPYFRGDVGNAERLIADIGRFEQTCSEAVDDPTFSQWTVRQYLDARDYSQEFRNFYFLPRAAADLSAATSAIAEQSIAGVVGSWLAHAGARPGGRRVTVAGGMHTLWGAAERWLRGREVALHLATRVAGIARTADEVHVRIVDSGKASRTLVFDHVVLAVGASDAAALLSDATAEEKQLLSSFPTRKARLVVHLDASLLPADAATWGARNYLCGTGAGARSMTIFVNRHAALPPSLPDVFVTTAPDKEPDPSRVIVDRVVEHPVRAAGTETALRALDELQGLRRTWLCGAYLREPFTHEQAYASGADIAGRLVAAVADASRKFLSGEPDAGRGFDDFLREIPMLAGLDASALVALQLSAEPFRIDAGTVLFRQGDAADKVYLVKSGEIDIERRVPGDRHVRVARQGPRTTVGEMGLLDRGWRSARAVAATPATGYAVSEDQFRLLRGDRRPAAFAVMNAFRCEIARRARATVSEIARQMTGVGPTPDGSFIAAEAGPWPAPSKASSFDLRVLAAVPFFRGFAPADLDELVAPLRRYDFDKGHRVYEAGETTHGCLIVVRGALALQLPRAAGSAPFAVLGPGRIAGQIGLLDPGPHPLACVAREPTIAFEVDSVTFDIWMRGGSKVALQYFEGVTEATVAVLRKASAHLARLAPDAALTPPEHAAAN